MWRIVAVSSDGAETTASRLVTCEIATLVTTHRLLDLAASQGQGQRTHRRKALTGAEHPVHHVAVPCVGGHAPAEVCGWASRSCSSSRASSLRTVEGPQSSLGVGGDRLGGHRLAAVQVVLYHLAQDQLLSGGEHDGDSSLRLSPLPRAAREPAIALRTVQPVRLQVDAARLPACWAAYAARVVSGARLAEPSAPLRCPGAAPRSQTFSSASALRMIWLPPCSATVSTITWPSEASRTVPVTTTSCSGTPMPRN